ncbi:MAG: STAS domain-containing protein [Candidatus Competibacteraceae bacterium]|nr:STAS domain-containing protein [Candidatus Competibacteraceae bacterium]
MVTLSISAHTPRANTRQLALQGRLDATTAPTLNKRLDEELSNRLQTLIIDLAELSYISSAGIQCVLKARKLQAKTGGKVLLLNPQPQIKKVFEIIGVIPVKDVFASVQELDDYLDAIQKKVLDGDL